MSKIIAAVIVALLSLGGITMADSTALEVAGVLVQLVALAVTWGSRVRMGGVTWYGKRTGPPPQAPPEGQP
jgi:hypothetical protein